MKISIYLRLGIVAIFALILVACAMPTTPMTSMATPELTGDAVRVESPMARPAAPDGNGAAYFTIVNPTDNADRLLSAQADVANITELHETIEQDGVMRMIPHPEGFEVPAKSIVEFKPGGKHVMLLEIPGGMSVGDEIALILTFENAGTMDLTVPVMDMAGGMAMSNMDHSEMDHGDMNHDEMDHSEMGHTEADHENHMAGNMAADALAPQMTENGLFQITATSQLDPVVINEIHNWVLHVETADGAPVEDAEIAVDGGMPAHNHGFPTTPQVTDNLGNGDYLVEGVRFNMTGEWVMDLTITAGGQTDSVRFEFELK
ncbi:MAG: copper chaperone PCu(A)C [Caldilineaceae bacterium]|nr:copper chaperone PCu(A)C [Caldilineaceae bacterium]